MPASVAAGRDETIRVLIVSDSLERRQELTTLLGQTFVPIQISAAAQTRQAVQMARDLQPNVVLFVDERADVPAAEVCRTVYQTLPRIAVIVLAPPARQQDTHYLRQAMQAGARDVLPLPPLLDHLISSIQQATLLEQRRRDDRRGQRKAGGEMGKVIVVCSSKGGCGCSVIAANLAILLAEAHVGQSVVLCDLDLRYGDQRILLDLEPTASILELLPVIDELTPDAVSSALLTHRSGVRALLAPPEPPQADDIEPEMVRKVLIALRAFHNWVVVDLPVRFVGHEMSALDFADEILAVCTPDVLSIRRTRNLLELCLGLGLAPRQVNLALNRISKSDEIKPAEFRTLFENEVLVEIPEDPVYVQPRVDRGLPLVERGNNLPVAKALRKLAGHFTPTPPPAAQ
ncbi:MAG: MinD/ParA family protein [Chloroflexi bacterium]|nr:MinD/ParA family protein [Chloroflexota bacterium]